MSGSVNLHYIRAAIEANTGVYGLSLEQVREYLIEEGLLTRSEAMSRAHIFNGYAEFFDIIESVQNEKQDDGHEPVQIPFCDLD